MLLEKTQRRLCRLLFVLGCVLPTLAVASYTTGRVRPSFSDDLLLAVGERLGVTIACDSLATPRPGAYELCGVRLSDPAADREFAACDSLRITVEGDGYRFTAGRVSLRQPADAWLLRLIDSNLTARGSMDSLSLNGGASIEKVTASLGKGEGESRLLHAAGSGGARIEAKLAGGVCQIEAGTASHSVALDWLPSAPLRALQAKHTGFTGTVTAEVPTDGGAASGRLEGGFTLQELAIEGVTSATGSLNLTEFRWRGERIERLAGRIDLRAGRLGRPLVFGMCRWLSMEPFAALETQWADVSQTWFEFTQLACDVELDAAGLVVVAGCGEIDGHTRSGAVAHAVVEHRGEALLRQPLQRPLPVQRLVQAWRPDDLAELPANAAAIEMASRLPGMGKR